MPLLADVPNVTHILTLLIAPQPSHYLQQIPNYPPSGHLGHTSQRSMGTSQPHQSGYRSAPAYTDASLPYSMTSSQWPMNRDVDRRGFIPTPSEIASVYPGIHPHSGPEFHNQQNVDSSPEFSHHHPSHLHTRSQSNPFPTLAQNPAPGSPPLPPPPPAERFPCDKCDKTFSRFVVRVNRTSIFCGPDHKGDLCCRSHDRKRHYETQHHPVPVLHRCRYCEKEFSR